MTEVMKVVILKETRRAILALLGDGLVVQPPDTIEPVPLPDEAEQRLLQRFGDPTSKHSSIEVPKALNVKGTSERKGKGKATGVMMDQILENEPIPEGTHVAIPDVAGRKKKTLWGELLVRTAFLARELMINRGKSCSQICEDEVDQENNHGDEDGEKFGVDAIDDNDDSGSSQAGSCDEPDNFNGSEYQNLSHQMTKKAKLNDFKSSKNLGKRKKSRKSIYEEDAYDDLVLAESSSNAKANRTLKGTHSQSRRSINNGETSGHHHHTDEIQDADEDEPPSKRSRQTHPAHLQKKRNFEWLRKIRGRQVPGNSYLYSSPNS